MKRLVILFSAAASVIVFMVCLTACGGGENEYDEPMPPAEEYAEEAVLIEREGETILELSEAEMEVEEPFEDYDETGAKLLQAPVPQTQRMVIKDAEIDLLVDNTDIAVSQVTQIAGDYGGYIISAQTFIRNDNKFATLRLGIPSGNFETVLNNLRKVGIKVIEETASGKDVTAEYIDLESRLENLEATAARVRGFLEEADTVEEALEVNQELSKLEQEIERIKGQMRFYEGRAAFSTITVSIEPQRPTPTPTPTLTPTPTPTPTPGWNPVGVFEDSVGVLEKLLKGTINVLIWIIVIFGPLLLIAVLIFIPARWLWKRSRKPTVTEALPPEDVNEEEQRKSSDSMTDQD